ncbi:MAG: hypothetical protein ABR558_09260 [Thioalkalivibrio sp.]
MKLKRPCAGRRILIPVLLLAVLTGCAGSLSKPTEPCALTDPGPSHTPGVLSPPRVGQDLGLLIEEVSQLSARGDQALRDALAASERMGIGMQVDGLRRALLLLALGGERQEAQALELLQGHLLRIHTPTGEAQLARLLRDQIRARQALASELGSTRSERDALQRQLEELKAIEHQIRDRSRTPDLEMPRAQ